MRSRHMQPGRQIGGRVQGDAPPQEGFGIQAQHRLDVGKGH